MTSADFCAFSAAFQQRLLLSECTAQISPGTTRFFPSIYLPYLPYMIPCSYWALTCCAVLPSCIAFYMISVRQTRGLPIGYFFFPISSFLQIPSHDGHPCFRLYPSHYRADFGRVKRWRGSFRFHRLPPQTVHEVLPHTAFR